MSYTIIMIQPDTQEIILLDAPHQMKGGTFVVGGTSEAWLDVTYNYSKFYKKAFDNEKGIKIIEGLSGAESIPILKTAIANLGDVKPTKDYWEGNEGNAKIPLRQLLAFAQMRPDGVWEIY